MANGNSRSLRELFSDLTEHVSALFREEIQLAKAEVNQKASQALAAVGMIAGGAILALAALIILMQALVIALETWLGPAWSAVAVGGGVALVALILVTKGASDLRGSNLVPRRTIRSLGRNAEEFKEHAG